MDDESIEKELKLPAPPSRRDTLLVSGQLATRCQELNQVSGQLFTKLYVTEALQK